LSGQRLTGLTPGTVVSTTADFTLLHTDGPDSNRRPLALPLSYRRTSEEGLAPSASCATHGSLIVELHPGPYSKRITSQSSI
jgi:hypothetical protein